MASSLVEGFLSDHFWPKVQKMAGETREAPAGMFALMGRLLPRVGASGDAYKWLRRGLMVETDLSDTHPCLSERLAALGQLDRSQSALEAAWNAKPPPPPTLTAAQQYMGHSLEQVSAELESMWRDEVGRAWRIAHTDAREGRRRLAALNKKAEYGHLNDGEALDQCLLTERFAGVEQALPLAERLVGLLPSLPVLRYHFGRLKLAAGDAGGVELIEAAMAKAPELVYEGCALIHSHFREAGQAKQAMDYIQRAERHYAAVRGAMRERDGVNDSDEFEPHGLGGDLVWYLRERLEEIADVEAAYLVRKVVRHLADQPMIVLAIQPRKRSLLGRWHGEEIEDQLSQKIRQFPHPIQLVRFDQCPRSLPAKIRQVPGARICPAKG